MSAKLKLSIAVLLSLLVSACGFQLRGQADLPPQMAQTYIAGTAADEGIGLELALLLQASGVEVVATPEAASAVFNARHVANKRRVLSVSGAAEVSEYELALLVTFSVQGRANDFTVEEQTITITRQYLHDPTSLLGISQEEADLVEEMQRDAARLIIFRLAAARQ